MTIVLELANFGGSPALVRSAIVKHTLASHVNKIIDKSFLKLPSDGNSVNYFVSPESPVELTYTINSFSDEERSAIESGIQVLIVFGEVKYIDIYDSVHDVSFYFWYSPERNAFLIGGKQSNDH